MKKQLFLGLMAIGAFTCTATAQNSMQAQPSQQQEMDKAPNTRAKEAVLKLQTDLAVTNEQGAKVYAAFESFYTKMQKLRDDARASGQQPDREAMKAKRDEFAAERDTQLKAVFTADQYTKWKDVVEPSMRPQRKGDGGRP
jgi:hypothetical protein